MFLKVNYHVWICLKMLGIVLLCTQTLQSAPRITASTNPDSTGVQQMNLRTEFVDDVIGDFVRYTKTLLEDAKSLQADRKDTLNQRIQTYKQRLNAKKYHATSRKSFKEYSETLKDKLYELSVALFVEDYSESTSTKRSVQDLDRLISTLSFQDKPLFEIETGMSLQNRSVWYGLDQNNGGGAYSAYFNINHQWGIGVGITSSGLVNQTPIFDQFGFSISVDQDFWRFSSGIGYTKYVYSDQSEQLSSAISDELNLSLSFLNDFITPSLQFSYAFSEDENDIFFSYHFEKILILGELFGAMVIVQPTFSGYMAKTRSTKDVFINLQNFFSWQHRSDVNDVFQIKNYELSVPVIFQYDQFSFKPELIITRPVNTYSIEYYELIREETSLGQVGWRVIEEKIKPEESVLVIFGFGFSYWF